jgi:cell fate (sporulation/competence/biofilm development) regulator YmcA (YheA/YmcA/DUF963 family)
MNKVDQLSNLVGSLNENDSDAEEKDLEALSHAEMSLDDCINKLKEAKKEAVSNKAVLSIEAAMKHVQRAKQIL